MVEILRRGELPEEKIKVVICENCKSELRFKVSEAQYITDNRDGDFYQITCPLCEAFVRKSVR